MAHFKKIFKGDDTSYQSELKTDCLHQRGTEVTEKGHFCLPRGLLGTDKKLLSRINSGVHGESVSPPHTSRDLRPILHENISLSVLPACRQAGVSRTSPVGWTSLPARSRFGVGRWVVNMFRDAKPLGAPGNKSHQKEASEEGTQCCI